MKTRPLRSKTIPCVWYEATCPSRVIGVMTGLSNGALISAKVGRHAWLA
ncbi:MAG: hypothetical protein IPP07_25170 [Holophagales bacterium]|nr:hypothetical protein [Holophagales bacterium]